LEALNDNATPLQKRRFAAALEDATESLKSSSESAKAMLADQLEKKGEETNKGQLDKQEARDAQRSPASDESPREQPDYTGTGGTGQSPPHR
jgi:hypothetical protein